jgi:uncharacterized protein (DUF924 family)
LIRESGCQFSLATNAKRWRCVKLFRGTANADKLKYAEDHADIIRRFGRFPHRNSLLARLTTPEEQASR